MPVVRKRRAAADDLEEQPVKKKEPRQFLVYCPGHGFCEISSSTPQLEDALSAAPRCNVPPYRTALESGKEVVLPVRVNGIPEGSTILIMGQVPTQEIKDKRLLDSHQISPELGKPLLKILRRYVSEEGLSKAVESVVPRINACCMKEDLIRNVVLNSETPTLPDSLSEWMTMLEHAVRDVNRCEGEPQQAIEPRQPASSREDGQLIQVLRRVICNPKAPRFLRMLLFAYCIAHRYISSVASVERK